ncbi:MAG: (d)CMP kinase [Actinobacteria bacterium]|nr:MAG: (d)CMP kinase [Actinomycetota bacterium]
MIVAIDGPAGSGKSTVAKALAKRLGWRYLDTGAMYRSVAVKAVDAAADLADDVALGALARSCVIGFGHEPGEPVPTRVYLDGSDVTSRIRTPEIDRAVTPVSAAPSVREAMVALQRELGAESDSVVEGRDIGTVVFPRAEVKVYLTAAPEVRAHRRAIDHKIAGHAMGEAEVLADIDRRDRADSTRAASPLATADDAHVLDTTALTVEQVVDRIAALVEGAR